MIPIARKQQRASTSDKRSSCDYSLPWCPAGAQRTPNGHSAFGFRQKVRACLSGVKLRPPLTAAHCELLMPRNVNFGLDRLPRPFAGRVYQQIIRVGFN